MDACPACSWQFQEGNFKSVDYPTPVKKELPATIRFCGQCGLGIASPMPSPESLEKLYCGEYWQKANAATSPLYPVPFALARARWRLIEESLKQTGKAKNLRVLDIGAGHGYIGLVASAPKAAIEKYTAVEPDASLRQYMSNIWRNNRLKSGLEVVDSIDKVNGQFDVVVLSHILEHLPDPLAFLSTATEHLSAEGLLFVDVPNQDYLFRQDVFPHLLFFSPASLRHLLEKLSFHIIDISVWGRDMHRSPSNPNAPKILKLLGGIVQRAYPLLPQKLKVSFYAWYFGVNQNTTNGTWLRALCRKQENNSESS